MLAHRQGARGGEGPFVLIFVGRLEVAPGVALHFNGGGHRGVVLGQGPGHDAKEQLAVLGHLRLAPLEQGAAGVIEKFNQQFDIDELLEE